MKFVKEINLHIKQKRTDGANSFWCVWGEIYQDKNGIYYYTEYAKENPRTAKVNDLPIEVKEAILKEVA